LLNAFLTFADPTNWKHVTSLDSKAHPAHFEPLGSQAKAASNPWKAPTPYCGTTNACDSRKEPPPIEETLL
ncbi:hypothetical protein AVEN_156471-2-1, partial [Araneus ventricosus]